MTIQEIVRAAAELNISYGEYVRRYAPPTLAATKKTGRRCKTCGREIVGRSQRAQYCRICSDDRTLERLSTYKHRGGRRHV